MKVTMSAFRTEYTLRENVLRHNFLKRQLKGLGLSFQVAIGSYEGARELSVIIECNAPDLKNLRTLGRFLEQDCIMVDDGQHVTLDYCKNEDLEFIGTQVVEITKNEAMIEFAWTKIGQKFFKVA